MMIGDILDVRDRSQSDLLATRSTFRRLSYLCRSQLSPMITRVARVQGAPPGCYGHEHHDGLAVYMAMSRKVGSIDVGNGVIKMSAQAGDFIVASPGAAARMHSFRGGHWIEVVLAGRTMSSASGARDDKSVDLRPLHRSFHKDRQISDLLVRIVQTGLDESPAQLLAVETLTLSLEDALRRLAGSDRRRRSEVPPMAKADVAYILEYMDAHLAEPITLDDLAALAQLSPTRFLKAFRNAAGETPHQALIRRRLEAARFALMTGNTSVSEISMACGFSSQQHLTALFSNRFGISPFAFRQQIRAA